MSEAEKNLVAWLRDQKMHDSASLVERLRAELAAEQTLRAMLETSERMKLEALDAAEAERVDSALNGLALDVENARLEEDVDLGFHQTLPP